MRILMVGCGKMGGAILRIWANSGTYQCDVVDPFATALPNGVQHFNSVQELDGATYDALVIAVKPQSIAAVLPDYMRILSPETLVISIAAGFAISRLTDILGPVAVVRAMPNLPVMIGQGVTGLFANAQVQDQQRQKTLELFSALGAVHWLHSEDDIDRVTAISGSGPGYMFEFMRLYVDAAIALGFDAPSARTLVLQTVLGSAQLALNEDTELAELRNAVTSKNGTTEAGLKVLMRDGELQMLIDETVAATYARAVALR